MGLVSPESLCFEVTANNVQDPLDGIVDHRDMVDIKLVDGMPAAITQKVAHIKTFSLFRENALARKTSTMTAQSRMISSHEQSVWALASVLFDPVDGRQGPTEQRSRRHNLAKFWAGLVQETSTKSAELAESPEERAIYVPLWPQDSRGLPNALGWEEL